MDGNSEKTKPFGEKFSSWYDKYYLFLLCIPFLLTLFSVGYIYSIYHQTGDFFFKDITLSGGTSVTVQGDISSDVESQLYAQFPDINLRKLTNIQTGAVSSFTVETSAPPESIKPFLEKVLGYILDEKNSSTEFTGPTLSSNFYRQLITALLVSFLLMSIVVFFLFRTIVPSMTVIFAAFSDILMTIALVDFIGMKISAAGIAAFLMLVGYSVDTDILLTSRAVKRREIPLNQRIYGAFKTGLLMTLTALIAVIPIFFVSSGIPDSFRQIFFILGIGLFADILSTWLTNASLIKLYCERNNI